MAKQIVTTMIDDIDGSEACETVKFGLDGHSYEIDLSAENARRLRDFLAVYVENGTRVSTRVNGRGGGKGQAASSSERDLNKAIRAWAQSKGYDVSPRGRLKKEIVDLYHQEMGH